MDDQLFIQKAVDLALENAKSGGRPFAALVVRNGEIIATGVNQIKLTNDPTAHAELSALREAGKTLGNPNLEDCIVYASGQPCPMCLAAMRMAGINQVRYAFSNADAEPFSLSTAKIAERLRMPPEKQEGLIFKQITPLQNLDLYKVWQSYQEK
ncbi:nucleoside deaminase [Acinetobacter venetianus]|uniref:nucleoside deaminase n=1 Tax=Acinetobacter venetianus TaxID=52133 RepID=UPI0010A6AEE4|nr:nucleoside deaminase [Acinetobacter venetianus]MCR4530050.1 nucleoside deaminase [Acinetobacter venetianus]MDA0697618.1 nucleoside deaminase [Pseudomonadota bacterium]MDA1254544.1 nucleoside deaminase [Pseudomonadota bacterium]QNH52494.1 nucleoside deaminase [Acinetobacter venetianus]